MSEHEKSCCVYNTSQFWLWDNKEKPLRCAASQEFPMNGNLNSGQIPFFFFFFFAHDAHTLAHFF